MPQLSKQSASILKSVMEFSRKNGDNDLLKFWLSDGHRCIDKWVHYFPVYEQWFRKFRGTDVVFVEIGVQNGGSIQMWKNYFGEKAQIIGVDIDPRCKQFDEEQITIEIGSQEDPDFWNAFKEKYPRVDVLVDDGGHAMNQQIVTFQQMFPHIREGGVYFCEDCSTSYWSEYNGGFRREGTYIEFAKTLIDELNAFHTRGVLPPTYNTMQMGGGFISTMA